jgi:hypothetical protein
LQPRDVDRLTIDEFDRMCIYADEIAKANQSKP